jgi:hypothetical protein
VIAAMLTVAPRHRRRPRSDLDGANALRAIKLPNPMYLIPTA